MVWVRKASPFWCPAVLLERPDDDDDGAEHKPRPTTERLALRKAKTAASARPLRSLAARTSALHVAVRTGNYVAARVCDIRGGLGRTSRIHRIETQKTRFFPISPPCVHTQVLLSGCSAVPPFFFQVLYDSKHSPVPSPLTVLPRDATLRHLELFVRWKLGLGPPAWAAMDAGWDEMDPPPADDFTRGAENVPIPWVS